MVYKRRGKKKRAKKIKAPVIKRANEDTTDYLSNLSHELLCQIMGCLPLREVLCLSLMSTKLLAAAKLHLELRKIIHFTDERLYGYLPPSLTDEQLMFLVAKCPKVEFIYGLNPRRIERRRLRRNTRCCLSIPRVIVALSTCKNLKGVETSHLKLMEAILLYLPNVQIIGHFRNHNGRYPVPAGNRLSLPAHSLISSLHLTGIEVPELPAIPTLKYIFLQWVCFTKSQPFRDFAAPLLETFIMRHCIGSGSPLRFVPLVFALASATRLKRLELVGLSFLGRLLQRVTEDNLRRGSFRQLETVGFGACRNVVETDIGYLVLASSQTLTEISLQPSLSRDSLFLSLRMAEADFQHVQILRIGYVDDFPSKGMWGRADLHAFGLDDIVELPAPVTDIGLKTVGTLFMSLKKMSIFNCPHLVRPTMWYRTPEDRTSWTRLSELSLCHCHCLRMEDFLLFMAYLPAIECVVLEDVFREPPKGCSYVGLSAGTGLGMSSAIVSNQQELIAVNGNAMEAVEAVQPALAGGGIVGGPNQPPVDQDDDAAGSDGEDNDSDDTNDVPDQAAAAVAPDPPTVRRSRRNHPDRQFPADGEDAGGRCISCGLHRSLPHSDNGDPRPGPSRSCACATPTTKKKEATANRSFGAKGDRITRSRSSMLAAAAASTAGSKDGEEEPAIIAADAECSAHSDDIRQDIRWANAQEADGEKRENGDEPNALERRRIIEGRTGRFKSASQLRGRNSKKVRTPAPNMHDKSVGTSDPILEDDFEQVFRVMSETLVSLTIISSGISDICLRHCPKLEHLEVEACRVLRTIRLRRCHSLTKVAVMHCPKMDCLALTRDMAKLPPRRNRIVFLQPYTGSAEDDGVLPLQFPQVDLATILKKILQTTSRSYNVCVINDRSSSLDFRLIHRQAVFRWMQLVNKINTKLINQCNFVRGPSPSSSVTKQPNYPWGRKLYNVQGEFLDGHYSVVSDLPWIRELWAAPRVLPNYEWQTTIGLYRPDRRGHVQTETCLEVLKDVIPEQQATDNHLVPCSFSVYLHETDQTLAEDK